MTAPRQARIEKTLPLRRWFPKMNENRGAEIYRPKGPALRLVPKPKGSKP